MHETTHISRRIHGRSGVSTAIILACIPAGNWLTPDNDPEVGEPLLLRGLPDRAAWTAANGEAFPLIWLGSILGATRRGGPVSETERIGKRGCCASGLIVPAESLLIDKLEILGGDNEAIW